MDMSTLNFPEDTQQHCLMPDSLQSSTKLGSLVHTTWEDLLVFIFEGEVESLGGEVSHDIGWVTTPGGQDLLLCGGTNLTICNALALLSAVMCLLAPCTCNGA